jgi:hypothetical protein
VLDGTQADSFAAAERSKLPNGNATVSSRSPDVKQQAILIATLAGRGAFNAAALITAFVIIVALWFWNASLLTAAADENLRLIKAVTHLLPRPSWSRLRSPLKSSQRTQRWRKVDSNHRSRRIDEDPESSFRSSVSDRRRFMGETKISNPSLLR